MIKNMKKVFFTLATLLLFFASQCVETRADVGPKPSVNISFRSLKEKTCFATLLSKRESTGPFSAYKKGGEKRMDRKFAGGEEIWDAFYSYEDADGFHYLQRSFKCSETENLVWDYYPPKTFKLLIYYPESKTYQVSDIQSTYAFDSYFSVRADEIKEGKISLVKQYFYEGELASFFARVILTIVIELVVAFFFGFRGRKLFYLLLFVNVFTQIFLNLGLNLLYNSFFKFILLHLFLLLEGLVFLIEWKLYKKLVNQFSKKVISGQRIFAYALTANLVSMVLGFLIGKILPGIF